MMKVVLAALCAGAMCMTASAQLGGGSGWGPYPVKFKVQSPTNASESARYFFTNNIYHCLVFSNDGAFQVGNTTLPRTEQRFEPDYTNAEIQYQSMEMAPPDENSYCVFQIHTGDAQSTQYGSTTFMLFWFTNFNGSVRDYSGTQLGTNLGNKWFQLNVDHNLATRAIKVWINQSLVWTQQDNGAGDFYFKDGAYEQSHNPTLQMDTYITNILMWTNSGIPAPPQFRSIKLTNGNLVMTGGGPADAGYYLLASTNLESPSPEWKPVATNTFDANGTFAFTNSAGVNPRQAFYRLEMR